VPANSPADGIYALATATSAAPRAVIRVSGTKLCADASRWLPRGWPVSADQKATAGTWLWFGDCRLPVATLFFPGPSSATGEDVVELHLPGSPPLLEEIFSHLQKQGLRAAEAGEFTRRAFLNGKLDLAQAEAVLDLIHSRNAQQAVAAASVLGGGLGRKLQIARDALVYGLVQLEAGLDFEEGDSQDLSPAEVGDALSSAKNAIARGKLGEQQRRVEQAEQWRIALVGAPNAGKTSLFGAITGHAALISEIAGTTRDRLQTVWPQPAEVRRQTRSWLLCDLPGVGGVAVDPRDAAARQRLLDDQFDFQLCVIDSADARAQLPTALPDVPRLVVVNKCDLPCLLPEAVLQEVHQHAAIWVSSVQPASLTALTDAVAAASLQAEQQHACTLRSVDRHCRALEQAQECLDQAQKWLQVGGNQDLVAEEIRAALMTLAELVGEFTPEDLLDQLFGEFCVGK
jgi:tRNA modification GTPase